MKKLFFCLLSFVASFIFLYRVGEHRLRAEGPSQEESGTWLEKESRLVTVEKIVDDSAKAPEEQDVAFMQDDASDSPFGDAMDGLPGDDDDFTNLSGASGEGASKSSNTPMQAGSSDPAKDKFTLDTSKPAPAPKTTAPGAQANDMQQSGPQASAGGARVMRTAPQTSPMGSESQGATAGKAENHNDSHDAAHGGAHNTPMDASSAKSDKKDAKQKEDHAHAKANDKLAGPDVSSYEDYLSRMQAYQRSNLMLKMQIENEKLMQDYRKSRGDGDGLASGVPAVSAPQFGGAVGRGGQDDGSSPSVIAIFGVENKRRTSVFVPGFGSFIMNVGQKLPNGWTVTNITGDAVFVDVGNGKSFSLPFKQEPQTRNRFN